MFLNQHFGKLAGHPLSKLACGDQQIIIISKSLEKVTKEQLHIFVEEMLLNVLHCGQITLAECFKTDHSESATSP